MKVDPFIPMTMKQNAEQRSDDLKKEQAANDFEEIFAKHLVKEMTKDSFKMSDNSGVMGNANNLYREHITDALANELASQRKLGMADLVSKYWGQSTGLKGNS
ncbi:hypothetical protein ACKGJO_05975 [Gracilimonas sp. Q87]|uniref:hypothetical protein n=1 Tax=Gracilimonas sp. Q87 TaxID=3384766 RepID=UPI00398434B8